MVDMESIGPMYVVWVWIPDATNRCVGGIQEQQKYGLPTPELTRCLRAHILSLRAEIAYVDASAGLRTPGFAYTRSLLPLSY